MYVSKVVNRNLLLGTYKQRETYPKLINRLPLSFTIMNIRLVMVVEQDFCLISSRFSVLLFLKSTPTFRFRFAPSYIHSTTTILKKPTLQVPMYIINTQQSNKTRLLISTTSPSAPAQVHSNFLKLVVSIPDVFFYYNLSKPDGDGGT